jgi:transcriptional regulator
MSTSDSVPAPSLYRPSVYDAADPATIVRAHPFAMLISPGLHATQTPILFEFDDRDDVLIGHLAGRGAHGASLLTGDAALAVFTGPHGYVSPRWYVEKPQVPTWNYVSAQARGVLKVIEDDDAQIAILRRTIDTMEAHWPDPWSIDDAPDGRVALLLPMIRSFRVRIDSLEGVTKLSQSHPDGDKQRIIEGLSEPQGGIADWMRAALSS